MRLDPAKSQGAAVRVDLVFPDRAERFRVAVKNDVLTYETDPADRPEATVTLPRASFLAGALGGGPLTGATTDGDPQALPRLLSWLTPPKPGFAIVTP